MCKMWSQLVRIFNKDILSNTLIKFRRRENAGHNKGPYAIAVRQLTDRERGLLDDPLSVLPTENESSSLSATAHTSPNVTMHFENNLIIS